VAKKDKGKGNIPKTIAGIKVPKALRKGFANSLLENPRAREILADVLMAAAGAAAAALVKNRPSGQQVAKAGEAALDAGAGAATTARDAVQSAAGAVTEAVAEGARQILPSSMTGSSDEGGGKDKETFAHLAGEERKGKKDKHRPKPSKH
jgi:hypothetical protein